MRIVLVGRYCRKVGYTVDRCRDLFHCFLLPFGCRVEFLQADDLKLWMLTDRSPTLRAQVEEACSDLLKKYPILPSWSTDELLPDATVCYHSPDILRIMRDGA